MCLSVLVYNVCTLLVELFLVNALDVLKWALGWRSLSWFRRTGGRPGQRLLCACSGWNFNSEALLRDWGEGGWLHAASRQLEYVWECVCVCAGSISGPLGPWGGRQIFEHISCWFRMPVSSCDGSWLGSLRRRDRLSALITINKTTIFHTERSHTRSSSSTN